jgi:hypothetical protein
VPGPGHDYYEFGDGFRAGQVMSLSGDRYLVFQARDTQGEWHTVVSFDASGNLVLSGSVSASSPSDLALVDPWRMP